VKVVGRRAEVEEEWARVVRSHWRSRVEGCGEDEVSQRKGQMGKKTHTALLTA
jgi:hypothetical protein